MLHFSDPCIKQLIGNSLQEPSSYPEVLDLLSGRRFLFQRDVTCQKMKQKLSKALSAGAVLARGNVGRLSRADSFSDGAEIYSAPMVRKGKRLGNIVKSCKTAIFLVCC